MNPAFNDPGDPRYEVYDGAFGQAVYVRVDGFLIGVISSRAEAHSLIECYKHQQEIDNRGVFYFAA